MKKSFWFCNVCGAENHVIDAECQFCECLGADCKRDNCSGAEHWVKDSSIYDK